MLRVGVATVCVGKTELQKSLHLRQILNSYTNSENYLCRVNESDW